MKSSPSFATPLVQLDGPPMIGMAPMEGVVDAITRQILCDWGGFDFFVTEFIRVTDQLHRPQILARYAPELMDPNRQSDEPVLVQTSDRKAESAKPLLIQFLGSNASAIAENAHQAAELGFIGVDLNFGCPAPTVNRHDGGATLLKNPERLFEVISKVREAVPRTVSVSAKVRLGFSDKSLVREIASAVRSAEASWLTVHARTRDEGYRPPAHWHYIAEMGAVVHPMPVVANGEVWTSADFHTMQIQSQTQHGMIGRGALARPSLALECKQSLGEVEDGNHWDPVFQSLQRFVKASFAHKGPRFAAARTKQWLKSLSRTYTEAETLFQTIKTRTELAHLDEFMSENRHW